MVKSLPSPPPSSQQQTQIISPTQLLPPTPPLSVGAEEPTIEELLAEQDAAAAAAGLAASQGQGQGQGQGHAYAMLGRLFLPLPLVEMEDIGSAGGKGKKNRVGSRVKVSDVANGTGSLKGSSTARKGVGVYAWEAEVEDGEERDNSYELAAGESPSGKPKTNKGRVTVKRVPTQALQDTPSPGKVRPLPVLPETTDDNEESVASLAKSIKQTKTLLAAFEERLGEVERKVEVMEEREEAKQREQEGENKKGKSKSFMQRLVYRFFGISLGSKSTAVPSEEKDSNASSASDKPPSSSPSSSTPESRIQRALASRIPQRYHARLAAMLDPHTLIHKSKYRSFPQRRLTCVLNKVYIMHKVPSK
ncbi:hypothetical protein VKT23_016121 [Stygiomarasmius scandens]|uniref:Uncharacterized protein n=1 Tax=Marasmiellus scandens TaxID=2682957 RepID=A0ABR1IW21_9AGAR